jgi:hypothetical protein
VRRASRAGEQIALPGALEHRHEAHRERVELVLGHAVVRQPHVHLVAREQRPVQLVAGRVVHPAIGRPIAHLAGRVGAGRDTARPVEDLVLDLGPLGDGRVERPAEQEAGHRGGEGDGRVGRLVRAPADRDRDGPLGRLGEAEPGRAGGRLHGAGGGCGEQGAHGGPYHR